MPMIEKRATFKANSTEERELEYLVYIPEGYHSNNEPYPLVLFLHGAGERGNDLDLLKIHGIPKMVNSGRNFPFITIAPQCPEEGYWDRPEYVLSLISLMKNVMSDYRIQPNQVYGTGLSMGGLGILATSIKEPDLFAAIVPVCGGADLKHIARLGQLPIWLFHGDKDDVIPVENSISIYQALKPINDGVLLTIYGGVYHDSWTETYENDDVYNWLLKHTN